MKKVTYRPTVYIQVPEEYYCKVYGDFADEFGAQVKWSEEFPGWHVMAAGEERLITMEELGWRISW